jgi:hypothetical protein
MGIRTQVPRTLCMLKEATLTSWPTSADKPPMFEPLTRVYKEYVKERQKIINSKIAGHVRQQSVLPANFQILH